MSTAPVFLPDAKFTFPRSYPDGVLFQVGPDREAIRTSTTTWTVQGIAGHGVGDVEYVTLAPELFEDSTNAYTLDFIYRNFEAFFEPGHIEFHPTWYLRWLDGSYSPGCLFIGVMFPFATTPQIWDIRSTRGNWLPRNPNCI